MNRSLRKTILFILTVGIAMIGCLSTIAQTRLALHEGEADFNFPGEAEPFVEAGTKPIAYAKADLNGDRMLDYIVVLEEIKLSKEKLFAEMQARSTLIIVRDAGGRLKLAARNRKAVYCSTCGGGMGEPFDDIVIENGGFSIINHGGTSSRWIETSDFKYSRRDKNWLLVRVEKLNYESPDPNKSRKKIYKSPKDFGKIDFAGFDPINFEGQGEGGKRQKKAQIRMREAVIYLIKNLPDGSEGEPVLVPVRRQVSAKTPLAGVMKSLLDGGIDADEDGIYGFIFGLKFVSAEIRNRTARIDFEYDKEQLDEGEDFSWGATMREFFPAAVERTALQFEEIDRVVVCVEGLKSYDSPDSFYHRKCPKYWWKK